MLILLLIKIHLNYLFVFALPDFWVKVNYIDQVNVNITSLLNTYHRARDKLP